MKTGNHTNMASKWWRKSFFQTPTLQRVEHYMNFSERKRLCYATKNPGVHPIRKHSFWALEWIFEPFPYEYERNNIQNFSKFLPRLEQHMERLDCKSKISRPQTPEMHSIRKMWSRKIAELCNTWPIFSLSTNAGISQNYHAPRTCLLHAGNLSNSSAKQIATS